MEAPHASLAEILEVRAEGGLTCEEILALLAAASHHLAFRASSAGLFSADSLFIGSDGSVAVHFLPLKSFSADRQLPPELRHIGSGAKETDVGPSQMVWCLGQILMEVGLPDSQKDVGLSSLLNLMSVSQSESRPSMSKLHQMAKNKMRDTDDVTRLPARMYLELLGDPQELAGDNLCDEVRLSSTRSSLSIIVGGGKSSFAGAESTGPVTIEINAKILNSATAPPTDSDTEETDRDETPTPPAYSLHESKVNGKLLHSDTLVADSGREEVSDDHLDPSNPFYTPPRPLRPPSSLERRSAESAASSIGVQKAKVTNAFFGTTSGNTQSDSATAHSLPREETGPPSSPTTPRSPADKPRSARYQAHAPPVAEPTRTKSNHEEDELEPFEQLGPPLPESLRQLHQDTDTKSVQAPTKNGKHPESVSCSAFGVSIGETRGNFSRQNSLQPSSRGRSKVTGRTSHRKRINGAGKHCAVPEFIEKATMPVIRLRAQSVKRKISSQKDEPAFISVKLLCGQWLEVACGVDTLVANIFDTVAAHLDLTEHLFFGLALLQNDEYFFLDNDQRLEKTAPPGWKSRRLPSQDYALHLRFRYYPKRLEFIKTENTTHSLYLQLRQDMLEGSLRLIDRKRAEELASIALQAEYSDVPPTSRELASYFKLDDYLPDKYYPSSAEGHIGTTRQVSTFQSAQLMSLHRRHKGLSRGEAERLFIQKCQLEACYGAHYYRVYKMKPPSRTHSSYGRSYFDAHLISTIAIMPSGIGICRDQPSGARYTSSQHEWAMIRTLQFDKRRLLIATIENGIAVDHVFYTEHYTKSSYLVRFAATQHRFMMKMRFWQNTLNRVMVGNSGTVDVGIDRDSPFAKKDEGKETEELLEQSMKLGGIDEKRRGDNGDEHAKYQHEPVHLTVVLKKHPILGLGLTLVDGKVNDVQGVYVKSVAEGGEGRKKGLLIGDCILRIDGETLVDKTRHDAVELVRMGGEEVELEIVRVPSISEVLGCPPHSSTLFGQHEEQPERSDRASLAAGAGSKGRKSLPDSLSLTANEDRARYVKHQDKRRLTAMGDELGAQIMTQYGDTRHLSTITSPPAQQPSSYVYRKSPGRRRRQRAVSDFGALGDQLPMLNSEELLSQHDVVSLTGERTGKAAAKRRARSSHQLGGLAASDEEGEEEDASAGCHSPHRGQYAPKMPISSMYVFGSDEEHEQGTDHPRHKGGKWGQSGLATASSRQDNDKLREQVDREAKETASWGHESRSLGSATIRSGDKASRRQRSTLDWTNDLSDIDDYDGDDDEEGHNNNGDAGGRRTRILKVVIRRLAGQPSLGFQLASAVGGAYVVKQVTSEPAISAGLRVDDVILKINGILIEGYDHGEVVQLLKDSNLVTLEVERKASTRVVQEKLITTTLNRTQSRAIGLSLAKRVGHEGIFIRNIAIGSLAAEEGGLRIGDRVWEINGQNVDEESPATVVQKLRAIEGPLEIKVKRPASPAR